MFVRRGDVPGLLTDETFVSGWNEWARWKRFGLPNGRGPRQELPLVLRVIEVLEQEFELYQARELKRVKERR